MQLFSDHTIMSNDQRAMNGYQALADLDTNHDGVINAQDPGFSQLMIWQDVNGDGICQPVALHTLEGQGATSNMLSAGLTRLTSIAVSL